MKEYFLIEYADKLEYLKIIGRAFDLKTAQELQDIYQKTRQKKVKIAEVLE